MALCPAPATTVPAAAKPAWDETCERAVRCAAAKLHRRYGIQTQDMEDVIQDLSLQLLQRLPAFDPAKSSWRTFVERSVDKAVATVVRHRTAQCRNPGRAAGAGDEDDDSDLDSSVEGGGGDGFGPTGVGVGNLPDRLSEREQADADRRMDLTWAMERMTPFHRQVCTQWH